MRCPFTKTDAGDRIFEATCPDCDGRGVVRPRSADYACEPCRGEGVHYFTAHDYDPDERVPQLLREQDRGAFAIYVAEWEALADATEAA